MKSRRTMSYMAMRESLLKLAEEPHLLQAKAWHNISAILGLRLPLPAALSCSGLPARSPQIPRSTT